MAAKQPLPASRSSLAKGGVHVLAKLMILLFHSKTLVATGLLATGVVVTGTVGAMAVNLVIAPLTAAALAHPADPLLQIDEPMVGSLAAGTVLVSGWAVDRNSKNDPDIERVSVFLDGIGEDKMLGEATLGVSRPDVAELLDEPKFLASGWTFSWTAGTLEGNHTLFVIARGKAGRVSLATREVNDPLVRFDSPASGARIQQDDLVEIAGWAIDRSDLEGDGVESVTLYLDAKDASHLLGTATPDQASDDVAGTYGDRFGLSGWTFTWDVGQTPKGDHVLYAVARSSVSGHETTVTRKIEVKDLEEETTGAGCSTWAHQRNAAWNEVHVMWQTARSDVQALREGGPRKGGKGSAQALMNEARSTIDSTVRAAHRDIQTLAHDNICVPDLDYKLIIAEAKTEMETTVAAAKVAVALLPAETSQKGKGEKGNPGKGRP
jgi:Big-like domain-containing protein